MLLLVIRHGESEADLLDVHEGRADFELTARGHRQAAAMAEYVAANHRPTRICASPLKRAAQTAGYMSKNVDKKRGNSFSNGRVYARRSLLKSFFQRLACEERRRNTSKKDFLRSFGITANQHSATNIREIIADLIAVTIISAILS